MTSLLVAKQYIKNFVSKYEVYLKTNRKVDFGTHHTDDY